jgi:hypothetical protein
VRNTQGCANSHNISPDVGPRCPYALPEILQTASNTARVMWPTSIPAVVSLHILPTFPAAVLAHAQEEGRPPIGPSEIRNPGCVRDSPLSLGLLCTCSHSALTQFLGSGRRNRLQRVGQEIAPRFGLSCACFSLSRIINPWVWGERRATRSSGLVRVRTSCLDFLGHVFCYFR